MTMQVIGLALVHSLWEGGIIAAVLALAFSITRKSPASVRYAIGMIGLVAMVALPVATVARSNATITPSTEIAVTPSVEARPPAPSEATSSANDNASSTIAPNNPTTRPAPLSAESVLNRLEPSLPWLVVAWLIGLLVLSARMISGVARTRGIVRDAREQSSEQLRNAVARIASVRNPEIKELRFIVI